MERRHFLKLAFGAAAGAATFAAVANAAPLPPVVSAPLAAARTQTAEPAVVSQDDVDHLKPEQVRWGHHWHRRWHWHRRHWGRHWGWRRHHWHRHWHRSPLVRWDLPALSVTRYSITSLPHCLRKPDSAALRQKTGKETSMKIFAASAFVLGLMGVSAQAMPLAPLDQSASRDIIHVAQGCGPGFHRARAACAVRSIAAHPAAYRPVWQEVLPGLFFLAEQGLECRSLQPKSLCKKSQHQFVEFWRVLRETQMPGVRNNLRARIRHFGSERLGQFGVLAHLRPQTPPAHWAFPGAL